MSAASGLRAEARACLLYRIPDFGSAHTPSALKMRDALARIRAIDPDLEVDGEMQADTALSQAIRDHIMPASTLKGEANVLVMPDLDAANIAFQLIKMIADALPVGPILMGVASSRPCSSRRL